MNSRSDKIIHVVVATPLGLHGRGGIDRLTDAIFEAVGAHPELGVSIDRLVTRGQRGLFAAQFVFAYALLRLFIAALRRDIDLLHIHLSDRGSCYRKTLLGGAARLLGIPYIVHLHGAIFLEYWSDAPFWLARAIDRLFKHSRSIIVLGRYWAEGIASRLPYAKDSIIVLPNATWPSTSAQCPSTDHIVRITCLGQLGQRKGTPQLISALQLLADRTDWRATIAGNGAVEESRASIRSTAMDDRITIPGWLDPTEIRDLLCRTDILALPSYSENLPMVILEGFAHGIAVIATPVGAIPEVIESGRNGLIVPVGDVPALANALGRLIGDPELRRRLGDAARRDHAQRYEIGSYVKRLATVWRESCLGETISADDGGSDRSSLRTAGRFGLDRTHLKASD
jgi:glycosyltransferase involved in cell wall biosynthesis